MPQKLSLHCIKDFSSQLKINFIKNITLINENAIEEFIMYST